MEKKQKNEFKLERIIGIVLLIPPILGVIMFLLDINSMGSGMRRLNNEWTGEGNGYMSAAPIYLGLMAVAGAILFKGTDKKE